MCSSKARTVGSPTVAPRPRNWSNCRAHQPPGRRGRRSFQRRLASPIPNAEYFGTQFMGLNYGLILSAWGFAGLIGPIVAARARDLTGSFEGTLPLLGAVLTMSVIFPFITKKPARTVRAAPSNDPSLALTDPGRWRTRPR